MKRNASDVLRRGFDSMLANWPLLAIRIAESIVLVGIAFASVVAIVVPLVISLGFGRGIHASDATDAAQIVLDALASHWLIIVYVIAVVFLMLVVFVAIHSFVIAGCARIFVDAERNTAAMPAPSREDFRAFTGDRWLQGGRDGWLTVFWIYNAAWSVAAIIILVPFLILLAVMFMLRESGPAAAVAGCAGSIIAFMFIVPVAIVTGIWTQRAIVDCLARGADVGGALRGAWAEFRSDLGRHLGIAMVMLVVTFAAAGLFGGLSMMAGIGRPPANMSLMFLPLQFSASIANSVFSAGISAWFLACFASLAMEPRA
ncbi:MAG TPA: hypothetical protein VF980_04910 [Thermoanaerobaculia bacterium]